MANIDLHIEKLLLSHDCVIIPGLGGFVAQYEPAIYTNDMFYPPYRTIYFNSQLIEVNDGILTQSYMQVYDVNFPVANKIIKKDVDELRKELYTNKSYKISNLGELTLSNNSTISFNMYNECGITTPSLYGLNSFQLDTYSKEQDLNKKLQQAKNNNPLLNNNSKDYKDTDNNYVLKINKDVLHTLISTAAVIILFFLLATPFNDITGINTLSFANISFCPIKTTKNKQVVKPIIRRDTVYVVKHKLIIDNKISATPQEDSVQINIPETFYTIVLASDVSQKNADRYVFSLIEKGFDKAQVYQSAKMRRVIYSQYSSQEEAQQSLSQLRKQNRTDFGEAWVLKVKI